MLSSPLPARKGLFGKLAAVIKVFPAHVRAVFNILFPARSGAVFHDTGNAINYSPAYFLFPFLPPLLLLRLFPFFQPFFARLMSFDGRVSRQRGKTGGTISIKRDRLDQIDLIFLDFECTDFRIKMRCLVLVVGSHDDWIVIIVSHPNIMAIQIFESRLIIGYGIHACACKKMARRQEMVHALQRVFVFVDNIVYMQIVVSFTDDSIFPRFISYLTEQRGNNGPRCCYN